MISFDWVFLMLLSPVFEFLLLISKKKNYRVFYQNSETYELFSSLEYFHEQDISKILLQKRYW